MYFKHLFFVVVFLISATVAHSAEYKSIVPYSAGSVSDIVARTIENVFQRNTKNTIIIENVPGADTIVGTMNYKNNADKIIMFTSSGQQIFNFALNEDPPYSKNDFNNIIYLGTTPGMWVVRADSNLHTPEDLVTKMPPFVGSYATSFGSNITVMQKEKGVQTEVVPFKSSNDVMVAILSKTIDIGMTAASPAIMENIKAGKLRVVGTSYKDDITIDGIQMLSVPKRLGVVQFHGILGIALKPGLDAGTTTYLKRELWRASTDPETVARLHSLFVIGAMNNNSKEIDKEYDRYRELAKKYLLK